MLNGVKTNSFSFYPHMTANDKLPIYVTHRDLVDYAAAKYNVHVSGFGLPATNVDLAARIQNQPSPMINQTNIDDIFWALVKQQRYHNELLAAGQDPRYAAFLGTKTPFSTKTMPAKDMTAEKMNA